MLALNLLFEMIQPTISLALTEGPSQPEVQSFEPIGTTQMVDLFTGDFNYNIPLFNLPGPNGGYPVNLAYHAGVSMDDEASWVGLGWNINPGALVRNMRGLPDEFLSVEENNRVADAGYDHLEVKSDMKQSWTLGVNGGLGLDLFGGNLPVDLSASIYYNNYRGIGFSLNPAFGIGENGNFSLGLSLDSENGLGVSAELKHQKSKKSAEHGHKLSLDFDGNLSLEYGYTVDRSDVGMITKMKKDGTTVSRMGGSGSYSSSYTFARPSFVTSYAQNVNHYSIAGGIRFKISAPPWLEGGANVGINYNTQDYSEIDKNGRRVLVAGYDRLGGSHSDKYSRDFSRGADGQVTKESIMLSPVHYSFDTYVSSGQGLAGYFRPRRNDIGRVFDPKKSNESFGVNFHAQVGSGMSTQFEGSFGASFGWEKQGPWNRNNDLYDNSNPDVYDFLNVSPDIANGESGINENLYYQAHGEMTVMLDSDLDYLGNLDRADVKLTPKSTDNLSGGKRKVDGAVDFDNDGHNLQDRFTRNTLIHELKNKEVAGLGEFRVKYFSGIPSQNDLFSDPSSTLDRSERNGVNIENHKAGFKVLNEEGAYYVYGLPAYNKTEVENVFSALVNPDPQNSFTDPSLVNNLDYLMNGSEVKYKESKTDKYISKTTKSPYAHSYMLTSVQGADYVDVKNDGPTDDDLGYWVKFDYMQATDNYQWRTPYDNTKARYNRGATYTTTDDKASYQYGEKEVWYMARIETKSHIAIFITSPREDNQEALGQYPTQTSNGDSGCKLDRIEVYEKETFNSPNKVPLQTVHFTYADNSGEYLCNGVPNSNVSGKLTLKSVHFTSLGSTRGAKSKYEFDYAGLNLLPGTNSGINPSYNENSYDSWGTYRPLSYQASTNDYDFYSHFPYTNQFDQGWYPELGYDSDPTNDAEETQEMQDQFASAWCLNRIKLPSGGIINIDYESDDYAYVQHKTANQMFKMVSVNDITSGDNQLYDDGLEFFRYKNNLSRNDERRRRIWFKLETPFSGTLKEKAEHVYEKYVKPIIQDGDDQRNLYFKSRMELVDGIYDYVSGYLPMEEPRYNDLSASEESDLDEYNFGVSSDGVNGFVTIKPAVKKNKENGQTAYFSRFHPMALAGWTYLQTNAQELLNDPNSFTPDNVNESNFEGKALDMLNVLPQLASSFGSIRSYCKNKNMVKFIDLDKSCIRLASPDKKKFGGGHRVKDISISDNWSSDTPEQSRTYGQHYEYTIMENGEKISSGVARYEPQAGGDENALKHPIFFQGKSNVFTRNNLFAEAPVNEALFPGASVGYRQVDVTTLNTDEQRRQAEDVLGTPEGRTGGLTRHEFYTAKEFPTLWSFSKLAENLDTKGTFNMPIIIPFVGSIKRNYFHGTQAFLIETNDMHGKPKSVKTYELNDFEVNGSAITEMTYEYQSKPKTFQGEVVNELVNEVDVIANDGTHDIDGNNNYLMGVEVDVFTDQRQSKNFSNSLGVELGIEPLTIWPAVTLPEFWVTYTNTKSMFRTYTTNKVIHRSGIMKKTVSRDLQTVNETEILAYDQESGAPMLSKMKNEFGDNFYSYNIPAYYHYDRMGHAYKNINFLFRTEILSIDPEATETSRKAVVSVDMTGSEAIDHLVRGDELLITNVFEEVPVGPPSSGITTLNEVSSSNKLRKAYFLGWGYDPGSIHAKIYIEGAVQESGKHYEFKVIRSGRRNHHSTMAANYLSKEKLDIRDAQNDIVYESLGTTGVQTPKVEGDLLSATANLFKDDWTTTGSTDPSYDGTTCNPFLTGNSGIFRPYKSYTYVGPRSGYDNGGTGSNTQDDPKLYEDGVMQDVPMFSWELGNMENYVSNWEWVNEVTRFSPDAFELENVNRLDIFSSALYGYDNSLTIAVGGNASVYELGSFDFELSKNTGNPDRELLAQTNMLFSTHQTGSVILNEQYNIVSATMGAGNELIVYTDIPATGFDLNTFEMNVGLTLNSETTPVVGSAPFQTSLSNEGFYFNGVRETTYQVDINNNVVLRITPYLEDDQEILNMVEDGTKYTGKISMLINRSYADNSGGSVSFSEEKAHTGKKSMKVSSNTLFDQPQLKMIAGKKYVLSMWVSKDNTKVPTFEPGKYGNSINELFDLSVSGANLLNEKITYGKVIEGWQKVDVEFEVDQSYGILTINALPTGGDAIYLDDIRFSPRTGGITTYVYDAARLWLRASLNVDNYATLFFYDEEGNLTIKKQETEEGIYTITESRGHVSED